MTKALTALTAPVTTKCDVDSATFGIAQEFITRWYADDPLARRALKIETGFRNSVEMLPRPIDSIEPKAEHRCRGENDHSQYQHYWMRHTGRLAQLGRLTRSLALLDNLASSVGIEPVDVRQLRPFLGKRRSKPPAHVQAVLDSVGIDSMTYDCIRYRSATPPRRNISCYSRFEHEESAKLLREFHLVGGKLAGVVDPELGEVPAEPTEPAFLEGVDLTALCEFLQEPDGHAFYDPQTFIDLGFDPRTVDTFCRTHESDHRNPMNAIFDANLNVVESMVAVYELEFLWILAIETGASITEAAWKHGRGTQARNLAKAILNQLTPTGSSSTGN